MATAAEVFAIPELLEMILSQLPLKDLLLSQRVNTTFRNTVKSSVSLQQALFFRTAQPTTVAHGKDSRKSAINHILIPRSLKHKKLWVNLPKAPYVVGLLSDWNPDYDHLSVSRELVKLAKSYKASSAIEPSWYDMHLRETSKALEIVVGFDLGSSEWLDGKMKVKPPTMRDVLGFAVSLHDAAERYHRDWRESVTGRDDWGLVEFGFDTSMADESFTTAQRDQILEEPVFTICQD